MAQNEEIQTRIRSVMEDPGAQAVARVYADAFLEAAAAVGIEDALQEFASFLDDLLAAHPEFEQLLVAGIVGRGDKIGLIDRVVGPHGSELFTNFLRVLARHDRLSLLPTILEESQIKYELRSGRRRVQVRSAIPLSGQVLEQIRQRMSERFSFDPIFDARDDPSLLGGLVIQVGDTVYDSSLKTRMKQLRDRFSQRSLHEIQSGRNRFSYPDGD